MKGATPEMNLRWGGGFATLGQTPAPLPRTRDYESPRLRDRKIPPTRHSGSLIAERNWKHECKCFFRGFSVG